MKPKKTKEKKRINIINNRGLIIGIILGIIVFTATVYGATTLFLSEDVSYDNTTSGLSSTNVQDALDELNTRMQGCNSGGNSNSELELGDYFSLTPDANTYTISPATTGYSSNQIILPSELTLWRVIDVHTDGRVDAVSEYVSSTVVYFIGTTGYANFVGGLQTIAEQYAKSGYTTSTRMMGYGGQTKTIQDTSKFDGTNNKAPSTSSTATPTTGVGGEDQTVNTLGDTLYLRDYLLVQNVYQQDNNEDNYCSTGVCAYQVGTTTKTIYWLASRRFHYSYLTLFYFDGRHITDRGSISSNDIRYYYNSWRNGSAANTVRPIITLKTGVSIASGNGTKDSPYVFN